MNASDQVFIPVQYADSDSTVNAGARIESESRFNPATTLVYVAAGKTEKVAEPVSEFIRFLIERWEADGKKLKDLAATAVGENGKGLAKSMPSQIKLRTSDASFYSAAKLAGPLGYADLPELVTAAYAWWRSADRTQLPTNGRGSPVAEAIRDALKYGVTQDQIDRVLQRLPMDRYDEMSGGWWLMRFLEEQSLDRDAAAARLGRERSPHATLKVATDRSAKSKQARRDANAAAKTSRAPTSETKTR